MSSAQFVRALSELNLDNTFNPYSDRCVVHDLPDAPERRAQALLDMLESAAGKRVHSMWIGRDPGYRGARRTGLALTDDSHIAAHTERWDMSMQRPTRGNVVVERTATITWRVLSRLDMPIFLWNVFPLHPHEPGEPFSNRRHNSVERGIGEYFLDQLLLLLSPCRLVAIGNDAAYSARRLADATLEVVQVRHPSYGGQQQFISQMHDLYGINSEENEPCNATLFGSEEPNPY
ncbi:MAG: uracil-DNA glycosylase [Chloroflexi bacterium]|nr:uracil-DNA glycosylase [Chloroflexota bacterium]